MKVLRTRFFNEEGWMASDIFIKGFYGIKG